MKHASISPNAFHELYVGILCNFWVNKKREARVTARIHKLLSFHFYRQSPCFLVKLLNVFTIFLNKIYCIQIFFQKKTTLRTRPNWSEPNTGSTSLQLKKKIIKSRSPSRMFWSNKHKKCNRILSYPFNSTDARGARWWECRVSYGDGTSSDETALSWAFTPSGQVHLW